MQSAESQYAFFATRTSVCGHTRTVTVEGEVDIAVVDELAAAVDDALRRAPETVVIDLAATDFIDVSGVRTLLRAHGHAVARSVRLVIVPAPPRVQRIFAACGVEGTLPFVAGPPRETHARRITRRPAFRNSRIAGESGSILAGDGTDRSLGIRRTAHAVPRNAAPYA
jgi:anti-anti-sigma factor